MSRIQSAIEARCQAGHRAFVPFLTAGYPDAATTVRATVELAEAGAAVVEIGVPFSDPVADGPIIQEASAAALAAGTTPARVLEMVADIREKTKVPLVIMTYLNPFMQFRNHQGKGFAEQARAHGVDGILITDLPPDQPHEGWDEMQAAGVDPILLVTPTTPAHRLATIAARARGFVYCVGRLGVTGTGPAAHSRLASLVKSVRAAIPLPVLIGFGIRNAEEARRAAGLADGVVVGSALLQCMQGARDPVKAMRALATEMIQALSVPAS